MDLNAVQTTITFLEDKVTSSSGPAKDNYEAALTEAQQTLKRMLGTIGQTKIADTQSTYKKHINIKAIESAITDCCFHGRDISETTRFIERLEKVYKITVVDVDQTLEADFLKLVKLKLSDSVYKTIQDTDVSTFEKLKTWIKLTYGGQFNAYQILQRGFDVEFKIEEKFSTYSQKVSEEFRTGLVAIQKQYTDIKGGSSTLTNEALMEFVAGLLVSNNLRQHCWPIFKDMVNDMDRMLTSTEVANKAEYYRERLGTDYITTGAYWTKPKVNSDNGVKNVTNRRQGWNYDKSGNPIRCWNCEQLGHTRWKCPNLKKEENIDEKINVKGTPSFDLNRTSAENEVGPKFKDDSNVMITKNDKDEKENINPSSIFAPVSPFQ